MAPPPSFRPTPSDLKGLHPLGTHRTGENRCSLQMKGLRCCANGTRLLREWFGFAFKISMVIPGTLLRRGRARSCASATWLGARSGRSSRPPRPGPPRTPGGRSSWPGSTDCQNPILHVIHASRVPTREGLFENFEVEIIVIVRQVWRGSGAPARADCVGRGQPYLRKVTGLAGPIGLLAGASLFVSL